MLQSETTLVSMVCATTSNHEEVPDPCLALVAVGKEASFATLSVVADSQLRMRDIEGFGNNASCPPKKQSRQKAVVESPSKL